MAPPMIPGVARSSKATAQGIRKANSTSKIINRIATTLKRMLNLLWEGVILWKPHSYAAPFLSVGFRGETNAAIATDITPKKIPTPMNTKTGR